MKVCTFFGHRYIDNGIEPILRESLINLIEKNGVDLFYVGHQGNFDGLVKKVLKELKVIYPHIKYFVVLAYMPTKKEFFLEENLIDTIYPDNLESVPPRYAISRRNRWMLEKAEYVITYVEHNVGGAAQFKELAEKKEKKVINIVKNNSR